MQLWYHDLLLREDIQSGVDRLEAGRLLATALIPDAEKRFREDPRLASWLARVDLLRRNVPDLDWPEYDAPVFAEILEEACQGKTTVEEVERADLIPYLAGRLGHDQARELKVGAPESMTIPSGRSVRLDYQPGRPPILAVRVQDLFGWTQTPRIARGRVPVLLHILAPNQRPVQITDDLLSFWRTTYQQVRKDLRGRYPKHSWPEDPLTATASAAVRRKPER
jgi:ATP-dependent helicase HrpB